MAAIITCLSVCLIFASCEVEEDLSSEKQIYSFSFAEPPVYGTIDEGARTISVEVPKGTSVSALVPEIEVSENATVHPASGVAQNFTNPVSYTVKAEDGSTESYTVTVTIASGGEHSFNYNLPNNVLIKYESESVLGIEHFTFIKIGNSYFTSGTAYGVFIGYTYLKYDNGTWTSYSAMAAGGVSIPWERGESYTDPEEVKYLERKLLSWMAADEGYLALANSRTTVVGTETIAGVPTTIYKLVDILFTYTYNHK